MKQILRLWLFIRCIKSLSCSPNVCHDNVKNIFILFLKLFCCCRGSCDFIHKATLENNLRYNRRKQDDDYQDFQMSQIKLNNLPESRSEDKLKTKSGQPVVVLNQLNSEIDVTAVVDEILSNKEFCNASSLFVIVPTSDDEDDPRKSDDAIDNPTCFHLSKNYNKWNCSDEEELC